MLGTLVSFTLTMVSSVGLAASFYAICVVCDGHLVPAVEVFIQQLRIPEDIAGVTLVAFGSAAPELFLNMVAAFQNSSELSLPAVLGSAVIAFGLIPSLCILVVAGQQSSSHVQLSAWPIVRETTFYLFGLGTFCFAIQDGEIEYEEALGLVLVYAVYVGSVAGFYIVGSPTSLSSPSSSSSSLHQSSLSDAESPLLLSSDTENVVESKLPSSPSISSSSSSASKSPSVKSRSNSNSNSNASLSLSSSMSLTREDRSESEGEEDVEEAAPNLSGGHDFRLLRLIFKAMWEHITVPVNHIVSSMFPSLVVVGYEGGGGEGGGAGGRRPLYSIPSASFSLAACVVGISVLAYAIIFFTNLLVAQIGVGTTTVGATLVSLGAEIPDTISSISLSRNGHHDGAMAGAIGSQVINITLGVGLPALISCWLYGGSLLIDPEELKSLWLLTGLVAAVVVGYAAVSLPLFRVLACHITRYTTIKRPGALFLLALWVAANAVFVVTNEEMRGP